MDNGITFVFAKKARAECTREGQFWAAKVVESLVCGLIGAPACLKKGHIHNRFFCVRRDYDPVTLSARLTTSIQRCDGPAMWAGW